MLKHRLNRLAIRTALWFTTTRWVMDRRDLKYYARENGLFKYFGSASVYELGPPGYPSQVAPSLQQRYGEYQAPVPFVAELADVSLIGPYPIPYKDGRLLTEPIGNRRNLLLNLVYGVTDRRTSTRPSRNEELDCVCLLFNSQSRGFFHWVVEDLARIEGVVRYEEETGRRPTILLPPQPKPFQVETLELLGFGEDDWIEWDRWFGTVNRLVIPSVRRSYTDGVASPVQTEWLRKQMLEATEDVDHEFSSRIYISRDDSTRRRLVNEVELMDVLEDEGFECYKMSEHSEAENVRLFADADVIVSPHGAGLTNVMYASDATVVELRPNNDYSWVYYVMSQKSGLEYRYVEGDDSPEGEDFRIDPQEVLKALPELNAHY